MPPATRASPQQPTVDAVAARKLSQSLDQLILLAQQCDTLPLLQSAALKFQLEQAASKASFDAETAGAADPPRSSSLGRSRSPREDEPTATPSPPQAGPADVQLGSAGADALPVVTPATIGGAATVTVDATPLPTPEGGAAAAPTMPMSLATRHMKAALCRMYDFALVAARAALHVAQRTSSSPGVAPPATQDESAGMQDPSIGHPRSTSSGDGSVGPFMSDLSPGGVVSSAVAGLRLQPSQQRSPTGGGGAGSFGLFPTADFSSSHEDLSSRDAERDLVAHIAHYALDVLASVFIVSEPLRPEIQRFVMEEGRGGGRDSLEHLTEALSLDRQVELDWFAEGFKTDHMRWLANLTFGCPAACRVVAATDKSLCSVLNGTRIDEDNPGLVEWAEFATRNVCLGCQEAQDKIRALSPMRLAGDSGLGAGVEASILSKVQQKASLSGGGGGAAATGAATTTTSVSPSSAPRSPL